MGVPKFYRWLSERMPMINTTINSQSLVPPFDNLYLDMNGIIHRCVHPSEDRMENWKDLSYEAMVQNIFQYLDIIFNLVRPQRLLLLAVDGVAPRAKMNQQRSRRFRSARDDKEFLDKAALDGTEIPENRFDTNAITPGTEFMVKLSTEIKYFIAKKIKEDERWRRIQVIYSGHDDPGEGEHKVMAYIRHNKLLGGEYWAPNLRHCLYGLDADLIMLGLATHEPNFSLLREDVVAMEAKKFKKLQTDILHTPWQLLHLCVVREYLDKEFRVIQNELSFPYDLERIIDDFVLICFFIGNDFLPPLPFLEIANGSLNEMISLYKDVLKEVDGYFSATGAINWERMSVYLEKLREMEVHRLSDLAEHAKLLAEKKSSGGKKKGNQKPQSQRGSMSTSAPSKGKSEKAIVDGDGDGQPRHQKDSLALKNLLGLSAASSGADEGGVASATIELKSILGLPTQSPSFSKPSDELKSLLGLPAIAPLNEKNEKGNNKHKEEQSDAGGEEEEEQELIDAYYELLQIPKDQVVAPEEWKQLYYERKFAEQCGESGFRSQLCHEYLRGVVWVLKYYYDGVMSWNWFYPYHYAPLVSDLVNTSSFEFDFELSKPFPPLCQLLGVLSPLSGKLLPKPYRELMTNPRSTLLELYPEAFEVDMDGCKNAWEGVVILPFIDEKKLFKEVDAIDPSSLTADEQFRNQFGPSKLFRYNADVVHEHTSHLAAFPTIHECHCGERVYSLPALLSEKAEHSFFSLLSNAELGKSAPVLFPSLAYVESSAHLEPVNVSVFRYPSKRESVVLTPEVEPPPSMEWIQENIVGNTIFVNWPYCMEAKVVAAANSESRIAEGSKELEKFNDGERQKYLEECERVKRKLLTTKAVKLDVVNILLFVRAFEGMIDEKGVMKKKFMETVEVYPWQLCVRSISSWEAHYSVSGIPRSLPERFPVGSKFICVKPGKSYGRVCEVIKYGKNGNVMVNFLNPDIPVPLFTSEIVRAESKAGWYSTYQASKALSCSHGTLGRLTGTLIVNPGRVNVAFGVKFSSRNIETLGFTRRNGKQWELSAACIEEMMNYKKIFPQLFAYLEGNGRNMRSSEILVQDLFSPAEQVRSGEILDIAKKWLASQPSASARRVNCGSLFVRDETIIFLNQAMDDHYKKFLPKASSALRSSEGDALSSANQQDGLSASGESTKGKKTHRAVKNSNFVFLEPKYLKAPCATRNVQSEKIDEPMLGDRVVHLCGSGAIPFGLHGTIIGLFAGESDSGSNPSQTNISTIGAEDGEFVSATVLFDESFASGTTLKGKSNKNRVGEGIPLSHLVNLTAKTRPNSVGKQKGKQHSAAQQQQQQASGSDAAETGPLFSPFSAGSNIGSNSSNPNDSSTGHLLCNFWKANNTCKFGDTCKYSHPTGNNNTAQGKANHKGNYEKGEVQICKYFALNGTCNYGDKCKYSHASSSDSATKKAPKSEGDAAPKKILTKSKEPEGGQHSAGENGEVKVCNFYRKTGSCKYADSCKYAHIQEDAPEHINLFTAPVHKAKGNKPCRFWQAGDCRQGSKCKFLHED